MVVETLLLGLLMTTGYRSEPRFTDSSPFYTSTGERVHHFGAAVSPDLLCPAALFKNLKIRKHSWKTCNLKNRLHYGDVLLIENVGFRVVNDTMNPRHKNWVDVWCPNKKAEQAVPMKKRHITLVRETIYAH